MEKMDAIDKSVATNILDLNEDCLAEISEYLDFKDLFSFYKAHGYFHKSIERVVSSKTYTFEICDYDDSYSTEMKTISKFLICFGKRLQGMKIKIPAHYDYHDKKVVSLVVNNIETLIESCCANGNIKYFSSENFDFSAEFIQDNGIFIKSLRSLEIDGDCDWNHDLFLQLQNVKKLKIKADGIDDIGEFLENLCQLETLHLSGFYSRNNFRNLPINLSVKRLEIPNCDCDPSLLVKYFPNLEYLEFDKQNTTFPLEPLLELPKLKHFSLIYKKEADKNVIGFLKAIGNRNVLETLKIQVSANVSLSYIYRNLSDMRNETILLKEIYKMTNLKALELNLGPACKYYLKELGLSLTNLQRFTLNWDHFGYGYDYLKKLIPKILEFVNLAEKLEYLTLTVSTSHHKYNVILPEFYEKLEQIRCNQRSQKVLFVCLLVRPESYKVINDLNFQGKYVKSDNRILPFSDCDYDNRCGSCGDYNDSEESDHMMDDDDWF